ncbi:hypothetical protein ACH61_02689 [Rathayibacter tanaceti]|uniref:Uncharacterized protein n=1 Tax=Rathayibacter tanaceti TaxID=1671680 RepID=A0A166H9R6_9MICO|nr:hypothetical protein ACH61_02689 [Rathayibacter tanaceti]
MARSEQRDAEEQPDDAPSREQQHGSGDDGDQRAERHHESRPDAVDQATDRQRDQERHQREGGAERAERPRRHVELEGLVDGGRPQEERDSLDEDGVRQQRRGGEAVPQRRSSPAGGTHDRRSPILAHGAESSGVSSAPLFGGLP